MSKKLTAFIVILILAGSIGISQIIIATKPVSGRRIPPVIRPLINVTVLERQNAQVYIDALGTVEASQSTTIRARVSGQVKSFGSNSDIGKTPKEGELLIQLDDAMYQNELASKQSLLLQAMADYDLEIGQQNVAKAEVEQLTGLTNIIGSRGININNQTALALRQPQLQQAKAGVDAAMSNVEIAKLNLSYTTINAPYNALVISREVSLGSQANNSDTLFEIVGTDEYRVKAAVPLDKIKSLDLAEGESNAVTIVSSAGVVRQGFVEHSIASLDEQTRMGKILISIPDPLGLENGESELILGDQVIAKLSLGTFKNVFVIPRNALYSGNRVFIAVKDENKNVQEQASKNMKSEKNDDNENTKKQGQGQEQNEDNYVLDIRSVKVAYKDVNFAYITEGVEENELLIVSLLPAPMDNMALKLENILE